MALAGKIAFVTGAARGLGRGFSEILLQNGAKVALVDVDETVGQSVKEDFDKEYGPDKTLFLSCNVESESQLKDAFQKTMDTFGRLDIVCNNAGIINEANWEKTISINLNAVVRGTYIALEHMSKLTGGHGGVIINTSSMAGLGPLPSAPVYTATKHAVVGFTRAMATASTISGYGVRLNALCPGFTKTDIISAMESPEQCGKFFHLYDLTKGLMEKVGIMEISEVSKNLLPLVTDETKNGEAILVMTAGSRSAKFLRLEDQFD